MRNCTCPLGRGARALLLSSGVPWAGCLQLARGALRFDGSAAALRLAHGLAAAAGAVPAVPAGEVKVTLTRTREASGLYTVTSSLLARVTRQDRHSRYHCAVHYRLRGQPRTLESRRVNVTVFCESCQPCTGPCPLPARGGSALDPSLVPQTPRSTSSCR